MSVEQDQLERRPRRFCPLHRRQRRPPSIHHHRPHLPAIQQACKNLAVHLVIVHYQYRQAAQSRDFGHRLLHARLVLLLQLRREMKNAAFSGLAFEPDVAAH